MGHSGLKVSYQEKGLLMDNFKMSLVWLEFLFFKEITRVYTRLQNSDRQTYFSKICRLHSMLWKSSFAVFLLAFVFLLQTRQHKIVLRKFLASAKENRFPVGLFLPTKYIRIGLHVGKHWHKQIIFTKLPWKIFYITNINITGNLQQKILHLIFWLNS